MAFPLYNSKIACWENAMAYIKTDGSVWAYGANTDGRFGVPSNVTSSFTNWTKLSIDNAVAIWPIGNGLFVRRKNGETWKAGLGHQTMLNGVWDTLNENQTAEQYKGSWTQFPIMGVNRAKAIPDAVSPNQGRYSLFVTTDTGKTYINGRWYNAGKWSNTNSSIRIGAPGYTIGPSETSNSQSVVQGTVNMRQCVFNNIIEMGYISHWSHYNQYVYNRDVSEYENFTYVTEPWYVDKFNRLITRGGYYSYYDGGIYTEYYSSFPFLKNSSLTGYVRAEGGSGWVYYESCNIKQMDCVSISGTSYNGYMIIMLTVEGTLYTCFTGSFNNSYSFNQYNTFPSQRTSTSFSSFTSGVKKYAIDLYNSPSTGGRTLVILKNDGTVYGAGYNRYGITGVGYEGYSETNNNSSGNYISNGLVRTPLVGVEDIYMPDYGGYCVFLKKDGSFTTA